MDWLPQRQDKKWLVRGYLRVLGRDCHTCAGQLLQIKSEGKIAAALDLPELTCTCVAISAQNPEAASNKPLFVLPFRQPIHVTPDSWYFGFASVLQAIRCRKHNHAACLTRAGTCHCWSYSALGSSQHHAGPPPWGCVRAAPSAPPCSAISLMACTTTWRLPSPRLESGFCRCG